MNEDPRALIRGARTIAVLGANPDLSRPAGYVPAYLHSQGIRVLPVNARFAGQPLFGQTIVARLTDLQDPVDIVDVFRRPEDLPAHLDELLAMRPLPGALWLQSGIRHEGVAAAARAAGIAVVQDRCTLVEHQRG